MKKKLCYVISDIDTSHLIDGNIRFTDPEKYDLTTVFLGGKMPRLYETLKVDGFDVAFIRCRGKVDMPGVIAKLYRLFGRIKPDIVHTHLFYASITGLTAAKLRGIRNRVNTRHHSVEAHMYHPHAVYYDKYVNALSTKIVAITDLVADVLISQENVDPAKVRVVRHGFDLKQFEDALARNGDLKEKYGLTSDYPVVGVISRHIHWKGVQYIIPAFQKLLKQYPNAKLVLANAAGSYQPELLKLLEPIDTSRYILIPFEQNVLDLYKSFDIFVHVPIGKNYEAFGQTYIEALAMKLPSVFTLSGVANDFIRDGHNAAVVPFEDSDAIVRAMRSILENDEFRNSIIQNGFDSVRKEFHVERMIQELDDVYRANPGN